MGRIFGQVLEGPDQNGFILDPFWDKNGSFLGRFLGHFGSMAGMA